MQGCESLFTLKCAFYYLKQTADQPVIITLTHEVVNQESMGNEHDNTEEPGLNIENLLNLQIYQQSV